jgi:hypothetical protein
MTSYLKIHVLWFVKTKFVINTQHRYRTQYEKDALTDNVIRRWVKQFQETGNALYRNVAARPSASQECDDRIQEACTSYVPGKARMLQLSSILQY